MLAATFTLTNCAKEIDSPVVETEGVPFEIVASTVDTKTVNDGMSTKWASGDKINLFHAEAGTTTPTYVNDNAFTVDDVESGLFKGTLKSEPATGKSYDWFAFYPYTNQVATPANKGSNGYVNVGAKEQTQKGNDNMDHVAGVNFPLAGIAKGVASVSMPAVNMHHLASLVKVHVTNNSSAPLTVTGVTFTGTEDIVGTYFIDFTDLDAVKYKSSGVNYVSAAATLKVVDGAEIPVNGSADFYIGIKPFTAKAGSTLSVGVNTCIKEITVDEDASFTAGMIKTVNFSYVDPALPKGISNIKSEASEAGSPFAVTLENAVVTYVNGQNAYIEDDNAGILIYLNNHGLKAGDCLNGDVSGTVKLYNNLREITAIDLTNVEKTSGAEIPVTVLTLAELNADGAYEKYENMRIKVEGVEVSADKKISQNDETYTLYYKNTAVKGFDIYNIIDAYGYPGKFKTDVQFNVWENAVVKGATKTTFTGLSDVDVEVGTTKKINAVASSGAPVSYVSSNSDVATVSSDGTITGVGVGETTITASVEAYNGYPAATATCNVTVTAAGSGSTTKYYVKVTSQPADWNGTYLIVYETGKVAFDGSRTTLDAVGNKKAVTITDSKIEATDEMKAISFEIKGGNTVQSASGYYIGQTTNANGLKSNKTTTYNHTFSINADGSANLISGGAYLRYNSNSDQTRFRYFKSSTYTAQKAIALYKLED